jgi:hypothetical protein
MTTTHQKPVQGHNGALDDDAFESKALRQIAKTVTQVLTDAGEPYRVRPGKFEGSEILKITTLSTDHQLRFSVLNARPGNVHIRLMKFVPVFIDPRFAGWSTKSTIDFKANADGLSLTSLAKINDMAIDWLAINSQNARTPRTQFLARDGVDQPPSESIAGTFVIEHVRVLTTPELKIEVTGGQCKATLLQEQASLFNAPMSMIGCRVAVHPGGVVRILRSTLFNNLYKLEE